MKKISCKHCEYALNNKEEIAERIGENPMLYRFCTKNKRCVPYTSNCQSFSSKYKYVKENIVTCLAFFAILLILSLVIWL